ncbi:pyridoxamine 5'-phosphate oxidase family protein [Kitasatospora sp. A2-31]|uniref:pyridoxamine 5'-phosphate oxidase family protein n=1 Tax=Kitasatospora sp. A2-31 TaxID=2916414 RepID=UPI001EEA4545|nr:pyridoxamine 5'-phosphate oxidase family protein [Kitasatospora sp. A2-31]MCG6498518.1 pyridoxamine 5'-phosphate oxidase family protein [Kitasatospora sp. A2-31]
MDADREAQSPQQEPPGRARPGGARSRELAAGPVVDVVADRSPDVGPGPELDEARALELLAGTPVGRVVYTLGALPAVLPVPFRVDEHGGVLFAVDAGSELVQAVDGAVTAFEADDVDDGDGTGWFVTVLGRAEVRPVEVGGDGLPGPDPAVARTGPACEDRPPARREVLIRIGPELVVGRRLAAGP